MLEIFNFTTSLKTLQLDKACTIEDNPTLNVEYNSKIKLSELTM